MLEHQFNKRKKILLKACEKRGVRHFGKAAEIPKFLADGKKKNAEGVRKDGKDFSKDKRGKETMKRIEPLLTGGVVEGIIKNVRNKVPDIAMLFKEPEERGSILNEKFLIV